MRQQPSPFCVGRSVLFGILCSIVLFLAAFMSAPVYAAGGGGPDIGLQPATFDPHHPISRAYFIFNSTPGTHIKNAIRVTNTGTTAGHVLLYGTDATTGATSGAVYLGHLSKSKDVGAWINLATSSLTLAPGQSRIISFEVIVPKTVRPGQHLGGIAMEVAPVAVPTPPVQQKGHMQINTHIITIVAVEVNLPGIPIEALSATGIQAGGANNYQTVLLNLHNTGTVMLKSSGTLQLFDSHGVPLQTMPLKLDTFLPATSINYPVSLKQSLGAGTYKAVLTLAYGSKHILRYSTFFTITVQQVQQAFPSESTMQAPPVTRVNNSSLPWWMFLVGGFFVLCGLFFLAQQSRRFVLNVRKKGKGTE